jgi:hypothetical protein
MAKQSQQRPLFRLDLVQKLLTLIGRRGQVAAANVGQPLVNPIRQGGAVVVQPLLFSQEYGRFIQKGVEVGAVWLHWVRIAYCVVRNKNPRRTTQYALFD